MPASAPKPTAKSFGTKSSVCSPSTPWAALASSTAPRYGLPERRAAARFAPPLDRTLYEREEAGNGLEQEMMLRLAAADNIVFWTRNPSRTEGSFRLNGPVTNHYPDFIARRFSAGLVSEILGGFSPETAVHGLGSPKQHIARHPGAKAPGNFLFILLNCVSPT